MARRIHGELAGLGYLPGQVLANATVVSKLLTWRGTSVCIRSTRNGV
jgi:hypothetical protein